MVFVAREAKREDGRLGWRASVTVQLAVSRASQLLKTLSEILSGFLVCRKGLRGKYLRGSRGFVYAAWCCFACFFAANVA